NARLAWEQALLNEIGEELRHLLPPEQLVERVLRRLMSALRVDLGAARLLNPETGAYDFRIVSAPPEMRVAWSSPTAPRPSDRVLDTGQPVRVGDRSEEHTSELQSPYDLVCRLLLEKKKKKKKKTKHKKKTTIVVARINE